MIVLAICVVADVIFPNFVFIGRQGGKWAKYSDDPVTTEVLLSVLGISDIADLVSPDPYLWLMDSDPTPFFSDFKDTKIFSVFFSYSVPTGTLYSVLKILFFAKICVKILLCRHYFSLLNTFMRKGKDPKPYLDPYLWLYGSGSGRPKNMLILRIRIPNTASNLLCMYWKILAIFWLFIFSVMNPSAL